MLRSLLPGVATQWSLQEVLVQPLRGPPDVPPLSPTLPPDLLLMLLEPGQTEPADPVLLWHTQ